MKKSVCLFMLGMMCLWGNNVSAQTIYTFAGNGITGYTDSLGVPANAEFNHPWGLAMDRAGNFFVADYVNSAIRKISAAGVISTYAGTTTRGYGGDGAAATAAMMQRPASLALDNAGNLYIADAADNRIRKVDTGGIISTVAGTGAAGYTGDGAAAVAATFNTPTGIAIDNGGNLYVADSGNNVVRKINTAGIISTIAGTGTGGYTVDGGQALSATLYGPVGVAIDKAGNLFIAEHTNNVVRKINTSSIISTFAGTGAPGKGDDYVPATSSALQAPNSIAFDTAGNAYITDEDNSRVRQVKQGIILTLAGSGHIGYSGDGGPALEAELYRPMGLVVDSLNNIYISDFINSVVRVVRMPKGYYNATKKVQQGAEGITVYPDPATDRINVTMNRSAGGAIQVELQNMYGQRLCLYPMKNNAATVDVSGYAPGCYLVNCYEDGVRVASARVVVK
jgi:trimeric autotransporter adhesin